MKKYVLMLLLLVMLFGGTNLEVLAASKARSLTIPGNNGTITSNAWRSVIRDSGNTKTWDYQVSAVYKKGKKTPKISEITTSWQNCASLKNAAAISGGASADGASASASSSWSTVCTKLKYWKNTNGAAISDWRSNVSINPGIDFRSYTESVTNTAKIKIQGVAKYYEIIASV